MRVSDCLISRYQFGLGALILVISALAIVFAFVRLMPSFSPILPAGIAGSVWLVKSHFKNHGLKASLAIGIAIADVVYGVSGAVFYMVRPDWFVPNGTVLMWGSTFASASVVFMLIGLVPCYALVMFSFAVLKLWHRRATGRAEPAFKKDLERLPH
jgi:hypothetical protein